jgi:hypothetical protein
MKTGESSESLSLRNNKIYLWQPELRMYPTQDVRFHFHAACYTNSQWLQQRKRALSLMLFLWNLSNYSQLKYDNCEYREIKGENQKPKTTISLEKLKKELSNSCLNKEIRKPGHLDSHFDQIYRAV